MRREPRFQELRRTTRIVSAGTLRVWKFRRGFGALFLLPVDIGHVIADHLEVHSARVRLAKWVGVHGVVPPWMLNNSA
jgi:hypothetical protein